MWSVFAAFGYYDKANYFFCREVRLSILEQNYWSITDRQAALPTASRQQLETFVKLLTQQFRLESLIQGNFTAQVGFVKRTCTNWRCLYQFFLNSFGAGTVFEYDVYIRQILTCKDGPCTGRVKRLIIFSYFITKINIDNYIIFKLHFHKFYLMIFISNC